MKVRVLLSVVLALAVAEIAGASSGASGAPSYSARASAASGVGNVPQGTQTDAAYAQSF
jgi:hypothetical protein